MSGEGRRCPECGERHPFYGSCAACEKEHCDCWEPVGVGKEQQQQ